MRENENSTIGDLLIWVTVLGVGTFALESLCVHFIGRDWLKIVFFLMGVILLVRESVVEWGNGHIAFVEECLLMEHLHQTAGELRQFLPFEGLLQQIVVDGVAIEFARQFNKVE